MYDTRLSEVQDKKVVKENEDDLNNSYSFSESQESQDGINLNPAQKIDLWKKLQDLMKN